MSTINDIKDRLKLETVISGTVQLKKSGTNLVGICPFHIEKSGSLTVFVDDQRWHCFGCHKGGDLIDFVIERDNLSGSEKPTIEAIKILAPLAGVDFKEHTDTRKYDHLYELLDTCAGLYHDTFRSAILGKAARKYSIERGFTIDTLKEWRFGLAIIDGWRNATDYLIEKGFTEAEIIAAGVAVKTQKGNVIDRFRNRLMIPICDEQGRVIGFGGRTFGDDKPKYLNSPDTGLFHKGSILFGLHRAIPGIRSAGYSIVVEGYMDVIQAHQAGYTNVVAQMGTALSEGQAKRLSSISVNVALCLDPDTAGQTATKRGIKIATNIALAEKTTLSLRIIALPEGKDPDALIRSNKDQWVTLVSEMKPADDYMIEVTTSGITSQTTLKEKESLARELLPIFQIGSKLAQSVSIQKLAVKLGIGETALLEWSEKQPTRANLPSNPVSVDEISAYPLECTAIALLGSDPRLVSYIRQQFRTLNLNLLCGKDFVSWQGRAIWEVIDLSLEQFEIDPDQYIISNLPLDLSTLVNSLGGSAQTTTDPKTLVRHIALRLRLQYLLRDNKEIQGHADQIVQFNENSKAIQAINAHLHTFDK